MVVIVDVVISKIEVEEATVKIFLMRVIQTQIHQEVTKDNIIRGQMEKDQIMTESITKDRLNVIIVINSAIILGNAEIELKKMQIMLRKMKKAVIPHCF